MHKGWLILESALESLVSASNTFSKVTAEQQEQFSNFALASENPSLKIAGSTAEITISGILTPQPDFFAMFFGGGNTTYPNIQSAIAEAEADDNIEEIVLRINSPGGDINGMFETMDRIANASKPVRAIVDGLAASAAYGLASQASSISASHKSAVIGSIGVVTTRFLSDEFIDITSTNAPNKRPDAGTEEGKAVIRAELDEIADLFVDQIATGRDTTAKTVNADFGRGGTMLAEKALKQGMIDSIGVNSTQSGDTLKSNDTASCGVEKGKQNMTLAELLAKHPALHAEAVQVGVDKEKDRATAHLTYGEKTGAMDIALKAVSEGTELTQAIIAEYMTAGVSKVNIDAHKEDSADASSDTDTKEDNPTSKEARDEKAGADILAAAAAQCNVDLEA